MSHKDKDYYVVVEGYNVDRCLGSGNYGEVYLATCLSSQRKVALKIFPKELSQNQRWKDSLFHYSSKLSELDHNSIVPLNTCGESSDERIFVEMEYIPCPNLNHFLTEKKINTRKVLDVAIALAKIIDSSEKNFFFNHVIKPNNILIDDNLNVFLADFGIRGFIPPTERRDIEGADFYDYLAPEIAEEESKTEQSQVYSICAVMYQMISGKVPRGVIPPLEDPMIPVSLNRLILSGLSHKVKNRPKTPIDLSKALEKIRKKPTIQSSKLSNLNRSFTQLNQSRFLKRQTFQSGRRHSKSSRGSTVLTNRFFPIRGPIIPKLKNQKDENKKKAHEYQRKYSSQLPLVGVCLIALSTVFGLFYFLYHNEFSEQALQQQKKFFQDSIRELSNKSADKLQPIELNTNHDRINPKKLPSEHPQYLLSIKKADFLKSNLILETHLDQIESVKLYMKNYISAYKSINDSNQINTAQNIEVLPTSNQDLEGKNNESNKLIKPYILQNEGSSVEFSFVDTNDRVISIFEYANIDLIERNHRFTVPQPYGLLPSKIRLQISSRNTPLVLVTNYISIPSNNRNSLPSEPKNPPPVRQEPYVIAPEKDFNPTPKTAFENSPDLIIRQAWMNHRDHEALILLHFDDLVGRTKFLNDLGTFTFQCALSIDNKWDKLRPGGKAFADAVPDHDFDLAAGGFSTNWIDQTDLTFRNKKGIKMQHVYRVDLSNPQVLQTAKFLLIKINANYSVIESDYSNNVIALPLHSKNQWVTQIYQPTEKPNEQKQ